MSVAPSSVAGSQMKPASDGRRPVVGRGITGVNCSQCAHGGVALDSHASSHASSHARPPLGVLPAGEPRAHLA